MSFDPRLLIQNIPSFKGVTLTPFLHAMNEREKTTQTEELKSYTQAKAKYDSHINNGRRCANAGIGGLSGFIATLFVGGVMTAFKDRGFMKKPPFIFTAFSSGVFAMGAFLKMAWDNKEAAKVEFPPIEAARRTRLQTEIREIKDRLRANPAEAEKKQLVAALDALKGNQILFISKLYHLH